MNSSNENLIEHLKENTRVLENPLLEEAFRKIDRKDFVDPDYEVEAYEDYPLPIGEGQTISQPTTVAYMLELLEPEKGDKILDIGSGSGWAATLLSEIVGGEGSVTALEIVPELREKGTMNLRKYFPDKEILLARKGVVGFEDLAPYDKILVSASFADEPPEKLLDQLAVGGNLVAPAGSDIVKIIKTGENALEEERYHGFSFVPYID